jgi:coenzyme Q-binding protein COQ10
LLSRSVDYTLRYSREQLFDLVADVERYPEFLHWCLVAHVRKREADIYYTDQVLGVGPLRAEFESKTVLHRPDRIDVTCAGQPFRHFKISWLFNPCPGDRCHVTLRADVEFQSFVLERLVGRVASSGIDDMVASFEARARQLYGAGHRLTKSVPSN